MAQDYITLPNGKQVRPDQAPAGTVGYASEKLNAGNLGTPSGDVFNAFRGYVGPQGGTFGGGPSADPSAARTAWESVSGVSGDKLGDTAGWDAGQWDAMRRTFGGIGNRDQGSIDEGLKSDNPFLQRTALAYQKGYGSAGISDQEYNDWKTGATATPSKVTSVPTDTNPFESFVPLQGGVQTVPAPTTPGSPGTTEGLSGPRKIPQWAPEMGGNPFAFSNSAGFGGMAPTQGGGSAMRPAMGQRFGRSGMFGRGGVNRFRPVNGYGNNAGEANGVNAASAAPTQGMF